MKTLILMRHSKSDWTNQALEDLDRPLNARGAEAAEKMAAYLRDRGFKPDRILCSTARRARETLAPLVDAFGTSVPPVDYDEHLYMASATRLLRTIHGLANDLDTVMIIGHNPGLHALALALAIAANGDAVLHHHLASKLPSGAVVILRFDSESWRKVDPGCGTLVDYIRPKSLIPSMV